MLHLHLGGECPLYRQITETMRREIADGTLPAGARLPSSRQLAHDLRVSRITVATAYAELEAEGLIAARAGSGTYVLPPWNPPRDRPDVDATAPLALSQLPAWQRELHQPAHPVREELLGQVLRGPLVEDAAGFAWGAGDPRLLPLCDFRRALNDVIERDGPLVLGPEGGAGYLPLREWFARYLLRHGLSTSPDDIVITAGTQQTISLVAGLMIRPGDRVMVEAPTWPGALEAFETAGAHIVGIPWDDEGLCLRRLAEEFEQGLPRLIYTVPTFQNPTGRVMSARRRHALCALAARCDVPILEDDHVREVRFGQPLPPPLAAYDQHGAVIHAGSLTKSLIPSLRIGYVIARGPLRQALLARKRSMDLFGSSLMQRALVAFLESGAVERHWRRVSRIYSRRHTAMLRALETHFPPGCQWSGVSGGLVLWVRAPEEISVAALHAAAVAAGVGFARGEAFYPDPADQPYLRLNFAALDEGEIETGIATLGRLLREQRKLPGLDPPHMGRRAAR